MKAEYRSILEDENKLLSEVLESQKKIRTAVNEKDWGLLMSTISDMNLHMDEFNVLDEQRNAIEEKGDFEDEERLSLISEVRGKLVRCRSEIKALTDYINITKDFVQGIIDNAVPQTRNKIYSRNGYIVQAQPASVVLNALY